MTYRMQVYKITYPNGKIYVGRDETGTLTYFGSPSIGQKALIAADHAVGRRDFTVRKEILWEQEVPEDEKETGKARLALEEKRLIRETGANNPAIGYNLLPKWRG